MVFSSYVFLFLFLPALVVCYYLIPRRFRNVRNMVLLIFSLVFYGWSSPKYLLLLSVSIAINWMGSSVFYRLRHSERIGWKKVSLIAVLICNIAIFGYFKYTDFFITNINAVFGSDISLMEIVLPVGISFYTFQGMSYVIDVYRDPSLYLRNPLKVALYITLFPQLVAGPIVRFSDVAEEISDRQENVEECAAGLRRFIWGLAKKIILADTFGIVADYAFSPRTLTTGIAWAGAIAYTMQIYLDFSGYSDMAIGLGKLFGFHFVENFNYPYISKSITEFWRRWHISLSTWFRDYVYIPLGGNKCSRSRQILNMAVVWTLTGVWHGASWNFVLWGIYYLIWLILEKYVLHKLLDKTPAFLRHICTLLIVIVGWVLFRADDLGHAATYLRYMFGINITMTQMDYFWAQAVNYAVFWVIGLIAVTPLSKRIVLKLDSEWGSNMLYQCVRNGLAFLLLGICILYIISSSYNSFIYFQF